MLRRKIESSLLAWKRTKTNQGLLVTGARQIGKTSSIEQFARDHYDNVVKIDFVEQPDAVALIGGAKDLEDLVVRITALAARPLADGKSLLFFDEVQRCGDAITWMRYLANDGRFDVIYSGSMLGVEAYDFRSLPVGTIDIVEMFPMDFEEFCWANGVDESLWALISSCYENRTPVPDFLNDRFHIDIVEMFPMDFEEFCWANGVDESLWALISSCYENRTPVPDFLNDRFHELFSRYVLVGGMPEAVQTFVATSDTQAMRARQKGILATYRADITRYVKDKEHAQRIKTIYDAIPPQLNKENQRFIVSGIDKRRRFDAMASDFDWLQEAGVALPVNRATEAVYPLGMSAEKSFFKLYMNDVGLLFSTFSAADVREILLNARRINFTEAVYPLGMSAEKSFFKLYMNDVGLLFSTFSAADVREILLNARRINFGHAFENAVAQELRAHGHERLFYYSTTKIGEVDFLLETPRSVEVLPVEVKSGSYSHKHAALDRLMEIDNYGLSHSLVLHRFNVETEPNVTYLPIYMAAFL